MSDPGGWTAVKPGGSAHVYEWIEACWPAREGEVRYALFRVPGKWERRVRLWRQEWWNGSGRTPAFEIMQTEADDGCPLERGPVVRLCDLLPSSTYIEDSDLAGLEWRPVEVPDGC